MKQFNILKKSLIAASLLFSAGSLSAQIHPLAFTVNIGGTDYDNWYKNYVGLRFEVVSPASIAGDKIYKNTNDGNPATTGNWGGLVPPLIINAQVQMPQPPDSLAGGTITPGLMAGKIGLVYRGGGIEFGAKALACQNAGAIACVIINNINGGPVGMAAGSVGASVTIPVFMVSKADGEAMAARYHNLDTPRVTITNWGQNLNNDLGFIPGGLASWNAFAMPRNQMTASYANRAMDVAFIGNFGNNPITNVKVGAELFYTPTGSTTPVSVHNNQSGTVPTFTVADSIYAMLPAADYALPAATTTGRYDLTYTITSDSVDEFPYDNTSTVSFYATDSLYSKGRYDFTTNEPIRTVSNSFNAGADFIWGPMYYVGTGGYALSRLQYSMAINVPVGGSPVLPGEHTIFLFKWIDGFEDTDVPTTFPKDSIVQNGELRLVSIGIKQFDGLNDTSGALINFMGMGDTEGNAKQVVLDADSWYYVAVGVPASMFLGADGIQSPYPRVYGRFMNDGVLDYNNIVQGGTRQDMIDGAAFANLPHPGAAVSFVNSVDSFNFENAKGAIPAVAMIVKPFVPDAVHTVSKPIANVTLFPNPAKEQFTVSFEVEKAAKTVTYQVVDGLARYVSKTVHNNVTKENTVIDTKNLASGSYYLIITVDGKVMSRKFTVIK